jgi:hypothetical protein
MEDITWSVDGVRLEAMANIYGSWYVRSRQEGAILSGENADIADKVRSLILTKRITRYDLGGVANLLGVPIYAMDKFGNPGRRLFASDKQLRKSLIKLAHDNKDLRPHLLPLLKEGGDLSKLPPALREQAEKKKEEGKDKKEKKAAKKPEQMNMKEIQEVLNGDDEKAKEEVVKFLNKQLNERIRRENPDLFK